jgi:Flp pilus assembly protein TadG
MVALLALVLFGVAALAVDLGNAWSRKRAVQKQVDVSAIAGGWGLPMTTANKNAILDKVAAFLNDAANRATGQQTATITGAQLRNSVVPDGEVYFMDDAGNSCDGTSATVYCTQMKVVAPKAEVQFGLAAALSGGGFTHVDVQQTAIVRIGTQLPPASKTLPFWLPSGCGYGAAQADTSNGNGGGPSPSPSPTPTNVPPFTPGNGQIDNKLTLNGSSVTVDQGATVTISGWSISGLGDGQNANATYRFFAPGGSSTPVLEKNVNVTQFQIGPPFTDTPGEYWVYGYGDSSKVTHGNPGGNPKYTPTHLVVTVNSLSAPPPVDDNGGDLTGCQGPDRGNFGQLDSPRKDGTHGQQALALNVAGGLDHSLIPFAWNGATPVQDCGTTQHGFIANAAPDTTPTDGRNCIVGDTGNDGPWIYNGLVTGYNGTHGRLNAADHPTTCAGRSDLPASSWSGISLNNDVLSCFLRNGATLADISNPDDSKVDESMLDPKVVDSPRFVWLPVVVSNDRSVKHFQPIQTFVPAFITDETLTSLASATNGLDVNGNSVKILHIFVFNPTVLPADERSPIVNYDPNLNLPSKVVLVG